MDDEKDLPCAPVYFSGNAKKPKQQSTMEEDEELICIDMDFFNDLDFKPLISEKLAPLTLKFQDIEEQMKKLMVSAAENQINLNSFRNKADTAARSAAEVQRNNVRQADEDDAVEIVRVLPPPLRTSPPAAAAMTSRLDTSDVNYVGQVALSRPDLPQFGHVTKKPLEQGIKVFYRKNPFSWVEGTIHQMRTSSFFNCTEYEVDTEPGVWFSPSQMAYSTPSTVIFPVGTRILARFIPLSKQGSYLLPGIVGEPPKVMNKYRYLVFFDQGYARYVEYYNLFLMCHSGKDFWDEIPPSVQDFFRSYLKQYPERPMLKMVLDQVIKTMYKDDWCLATVKEVDASLVKMHFYMDDHEEWVYRGSTRLKPLCKELMSAETNRLSRKWRRHNLLFKKPTEPYVEYTRGVDESVDPAIAAVIDMEVSKVRFARKNTAPTPVPSKSKAVEDIPPAAPPVFDRGWIGERKKISFEVDTKRLVYQAHTCEHSCLKGVYDSPDLHRGKSFLCIPIYFGWERHHLRKRMLVEYRGPCGRILNNMDGIYTYLKITSSNLTVDYFTFDSNIDISVEFVASNVRVILPDITYNKETIPVGAVNTVNKEFPPYVEYSNQRSATRDVPLNTDPAFLCGCDCQDDCKDATRCQCQQLTQTYAEILAIKHRVGYTYRRLREPLVTGIYECNVNCKCNNRCLNRVAQNGLRNRLQVFKTEKRGWGIRSLDDIPPGMFICIYAGQLLTEQGADEDGNMYGDEYFAELDHIEVLEKYKEGYESEAYESDCISDSLSTNGKGSSNRASSISSSLSSDDDKDDDQSDVDDDMKDASYMLPNCKFPLPVSGSTRYSTRSRTKPAKKEEEIPLKQTRGNVTKKKKKKKASRPKKFGEFRKPLRSYFGEDSCYIMDAKSTGNIGRYLNHSCNPNVIVQNVFVDTHDLRFPWVAFFANRYIPCGTELTWDYNYEIGSVPGKHIYCMCGAEKCRGRLI